jgi:hypothetical protein
MNLFPHRSILLATAASALFVVRSAAQTDLSAAYQTAEAAAKGAAPTSCDDSKELETPFEFTLAPTNGGAKIELRYEYAGCESYPRNDYLPPYTQRYYNAKDGYGMVVVVNEGASAAEVLFSKGQDWVGTLDAFTVSQLASGDPLTADLKDHEKWNKIDGRATLRDAAKPLYPELKNCETADWSKDAASAPLRTEGKPALGWEGRSGPSLVLLTKTAAFYYHEDCDICAEVTRCELSSGALTSVVRAHSADCSDLKSFSKDAVYTACPDAGK